MEERQTEITWGLTVKVNLGNYETATIFHSIRDFPRTIDKKLETRKEASDRIYAVVEYELLEKVAEFKAEACE